jgi:Fe-S-cluster containining protein
VPKTTLASEERAVSAPEPWYAEGLRFSCTRCGNCCSGAAGYVWVDHREIAAIAHLLGLTAEQFEAHHTRRVGTRRSLLELPGGDCEFLERDPTGRTRCRIHAVRPMQCRTWPFWESNLRSPRTWRLAARDCPGMSQDGHHPLSVIQQALRANAAASLPL